ncbi:MAG: aminoacyl-tRNA hydrolase [Treponema sp.]|nr:aminoacyl-tRNA hydrolase [Treponema sp.]
MIQLITFLGNYGKEYERTRHNVAWMFEQSLCCADRISWQNKFKGDIYSWDTDALVRVFVEKGVLKARDNGDLPIPDEAPKKIYFLKPLTYMNLSGDAIIEASHFYKIPASDILIVHDEIELPLGTVSLKWSGGLGGHNGLRSAKASLGTADFWRLRFGVGKPSNGQVADYVLGHFTADEQISLSRVFDQSQELFAKMLVSKDLQRLIPAWGKKKIDLQ